MPSGLDRALFGSTCRTGMPDRILASAADALPFGPAFKILRFENGNFVICFNALGQPAMRGAAALLVIHTHARLVPDRKLHAGPGNGAPRGRSPGGSGHHCQWVCGQARLALARLPDSMPPVKFRKVLPIRPKLAGTLRTLWKTQIFILAFIPQQVTNFACQIPKKSYGMSQSLSRLTDTNEKPRHV